MSDHYRKLYQKVAKQVIDAIEKGTYKRGGRLPSERDLAEELRVQDATENELYAAMDWLLGRQKAIETKLAQRHLANGEQPPPGDL